MLTEWRQCGNALSATVRDDWDARSEAGDGSVAVVNEAVCRGRGSRRRGVGKGTGQDCLVNEAGSVTAGGNEASRAPLSSQCAYLDRTGSLTFAK